MRANGLIFGWSLGRMIAIKSRRYMGYVEYVSRYSLATITLFIMDNDVMFVAILNPKV